MRNKRVFLFSLIIFLFLYGCASNSPTYPVNLPQAPSNLKAEILSEKRVKLSWIDNSNNEDGFILERKKDGETWKEVKNLGINENSYIDISLDPGTKYFYRICAYNSSGRSDYSNICEILTPLIIKPILSFVIDSNKVKLLWTSNSEVTQGYIIEKKISGGAWNEIARLNSSLTTYVDSDVFSGNKYYYRIKAYSSFTESDYSNEIEVYVPFIGNEENPNFSLIGFATLNGGTFGGEGGAVVTVETGTDLQREINKGGPRIIYVKGIITPQNSGGKYVIEVKNVSRISILGAYPYGELNGVGIKISNANNIIIRNLKIHHVKDPNIATQGPDCISISGPAQNIWIDHCELYNQFQGIDKDYYDGLLDINGPVYYVTVSWCYFHDSWKTSLIGSSDNDNYSRTITFHHNWFKNCNSRLPSYRFGEGHIFNNYYQDIPGSAINSRMGAKLRIEHNYFENVRNPIGSWDSSEIGYWDLADNRFVNCSGSIPSSSTCTYIPPYFYLLDPVDKVKELVTQFAGVGRINP
ncbi:MAG: fibronectin type III domain-containing protein [Dictyoglomus sp.]|nr:fibronectin type III domain-containing protein [Dictyoglomus sp.]MDW8188571.1 fibronectin type III domain-containing protein [Dictyoglomus sp.]